MLSLLWIRRIASPESGATERGSTFLEISNQHREGIEDIARDTEEAPNLRGAQVDRHNPVCSCDLNGISADAGTY